MPPPSDLELLLAPLLDTLAPVALRYPEVVEEFGVVLAKTLGFVKDSGEPGEPKVWARALEAAISEHASELLADEWLSAVPVR